MPDAPNIHCPELDVTTQAAAIQEYVKGLTSSPAFAGSPRRAQLLTYLVERTLSGQGRLVNEYAVGIDVFSKPESFDPRFESVVRNEVMRLRQKLAAYYQNGGAADPVRIDIPKRSYAVVFSFPEHAPPAVGPAAHSAHPPLNTSPASRPATRWIPAWVGCTAVLLALAVTVPGRPSSPVLGARSASSSHRNRDAESLYLRGRYYWAKRSPESLPKAIEYFTQAIVRDPQYAEAYVGLADCYNLLPEYSATPGAEAFPRALAAAERAVQLDDSSAQAHASLAFALAYGAWKFQDAQREFQRAIALDPAYIPAHHWRATLLMSAGREAEALEEIERARNLDPASSSIVADEGLILFYNGRSGEAVSLLKQVEAVEPDFPSPHRYLAAIYFEEGRYPEWIEEGRALARLLRDPVSERVMRDTSRAYAAAGVLGVYQAQMSLSTEGLASPSTLARTCAVLGKKTEALALLKKALETRDPGLLGIWISPTLSTLSDEPILKKIAGQMRGAGAANGS